MARYIDADRLIEILLDREGKSKGICGDLGGAVMGCIRLVEATPAAEVVSRAEFIDEKEKKEIYAAVIKRQDKERAVIVEDRNGLLKENNSLLAELDDLKRDTVPKPKWGLERANAMGRDLEIELANAKTEVARLQAKIKMLTEAEDIDERQKKYTEGKK